MDVSNVAEMVRAMSSDDLAHLSSLLSNDWSTDANSTMQALVLAFTLARINHPADLRRPT